MSFRTALQPSQATARLRSAPLSPRRRQLADELLGFIRARGGKIYLTASEYVIVGFRVQPVFASLAKAGMSKAEVRAAADDLWGTGEIEMSCNGYGLMTLTLPTASSDCWRGS